MPHSKIDIALACRPALRKKFEALVTTPGRSLADLQKQLLAAGIKASRSGAGRWSKQIRRSTGPHSASLAMTLIMRLASMDDKQLARLAGFLGLGAKAKKKRVGRSARVGQTHRPATLRKGVRDGTSNR